MCNDNSHSPVVAKKSQNLKTTIRKPKSASVTSNQKLISPTGSNVVPTLPNSSGPGTALHHSEAGGPLSNGDQQMAHSGQSATSEKQLQASSAGGPWYYVCTVCTSCLWFIVLIYCFVVHMSVV